ncbi:ABC transporter ATP-binding protein [Oscillochloris sp. ZM17-4]|uniref:ABC transporter ATP-binding protein n=1 Tax=Oscillochloris sp. ZM17-4 TaxID=2866714 RepID=UPI001C7341C7|nr:ABC transporter ATP-binding protein [Oscillochloris sp. ZM17-4]MBX0327897.1 ABC transporter ATP-binding protein [Oscillochloris sp. ZM17-4]
MSEIVLETMGLTKRYGDFTAVESLDLTIRRGEVFGLLGPNGAGKTTTILMLLGLTEPSAGEVRVLGMDPARRPLSVKARVGYLPDQVGFYDGLSARENLAYIARLNGMPRRESARRIGESLERMGLGEVAGKRVGAFSRGMRQRLGLAEILLKRPELVIMDEPTLGLDPEAAREFLDLIRSLRGEGITIMLSSHLLHQVQAVCDRVGLFSGGRMVLEGPVGDLARQVLGGGYRIQIEAEGGSDLEGALGRVAGVTRVSPAGPGRYDLEAMSDLRPQAARAVVESGGQLLALTSEVPSLEEIYARYFQREAGHARAA